eukprot:4358431-Lingulodinium_polyedra.AAC.1
MAYGSDAGKVRYAKASRLVARQTVFSGEFNRKHSRRQEVRRFVHTTRRRHCSQLARAGVGAHK